MARAWWTLAILILFLATVSQTVAQTITHKSLSFKQHLPTSQFIANPPFASMPSHADAHPHDIARQFLQEHVLEAGATYYIRNDSYSDNHTGVSHIYARQIFNGLEVIDGNINLNIRDGKILSYGNSFFAGGLPESIGRGWSQENYCREIPPDADPFTCELSLHRIYAAAFQYSVSELDPIAAVWYFTLAAQPTTPVSHPGTLKASPEPCPSLSEGLASECWSVSGLAVGTSPVKAHKVYTQTWVREFKKPKLNLVWLLEATFPDAQYEAYVSVRDPSKIIASIDKTLDVSMPNAHAWLKQGSFDQVILVPSDAAV